MLSAAPVLNGMHWEQYLTGFGILVAIQTTKTERETQEELKYILFIHLLSHSSYRQIIFSMIWESPYHHSAL